MIFTINFVEAEKIVKNEPIFEKKALFASGGDRTRTFQVTGHYAHHYTTGPSL